MLINIDIVRHYLMESLMIILEKPKLALMKARLLVWSLIASLKHRNKHKAAKVVQDNMEVGYDVMNPKETNTTTPAMAEYDINHAFVCEHVVDGSPDCQSSVKIEPPIENACDTTEGEDNAHTDAQVHVSSKNTVTTFATKVVTVFFDDSHTIEQEMSNGAKLCDSFHPISESSKDSTAHTSSERELENETLACESSTKHSTDNESGAVLEEDETIITAKGSLNIDLSAIEQDANNEDNSEEDRRSKDLNNNRLEVDTSFCYYDNDAGYEADSHYSSSDDDNDSDDDDDDFFNDSDDDTSSLIPRRSIIISPIERHLPVSEGLRITVLKREARKALPAYFPHSTYSRR